ncbi:TetM/TetW/TetO/TetS family tetracycline resistance ribosomal protection protein [Synergistaceae bacterium OttesenSCG-928-I11]|nr:TetM/TetW/TetO/TetS family tetracycline resistance ribosomal protection protein [Synergistaceae bacterium OttesenSCG-928-I11]
MKTINIGLLAHVDAGKTTTVERMLYEGGAIRHAGSVDRGDTQTDWLEVERQRGISVASAQASVVWNDVAINIVDTPGHMDFTGEVERALLALDAVVLVVSAADGVQPQTETFWRSIVALSMPCVFFVNKCDRTGVDLDKIRSDIAMNLSRDAVYFTDAAAPGTNEFAPQSRQPSSFSDDEILVCVESDEAAALAFLDGERPCPDVLDAGIRRGVAEGRLYPVVFGSAMFGAGIRELLDTIAAYLPATEGEADGEPSGIVYKVEHDDRMGKAAHVRLFSGTIRNRDALELHRPGTAEGEAFQGKVTQIRAVSGPNRRDTGELRANAIAAIYGLDAVRAGDVIGSMARVSERLAKSRRMAVPMMSVVVSATPEKQPELLEAVARLSDEDPLLDYEWNAEDRELSVKIMGQIQLEVMKHVVRERHGLDVAFSKPTVLYRETPTKNGEGYEEYTMPKPCWAVVRLAIEPRPRGAGYVFESRVPNDKIFYRYQNHIAQSVPETLKQGRLGWQVVDLRVTLVGGEHHTVHTHNMDFFLATPIAVMDGLRNCGTTLLEPIVKYRISADESLAGRIVGDILAMRGETGDSIIRDGTLHLEALVPAATSMDYPVTFASATSGRGRLAAEFHSYRECPLELGATRKRNGIDPLDRAKWILARRGAVG